MVPGVYLPVWVSLKARQALRQVFIARSKAKNRSLQFNILNQVLSLQMSSLVPIIKKEIATLFPAYFALVMSTGIVSIGAYLLQFTTIAHTLLYINIVAYLCLWALLLLRLFFYFRLLADDLSDHARSAGFLTIVAGTNVLGSQLVILQNNFAAAQWLLYIGFFLWLLLIYFFFIQITIKREKPTLENGMNGIWLLMVVSTQSVAVLATLLADQLPFPKDITLFISLMMFLLGCMLYTIIITLIFYRLTFFKLRAEEFAPPYWINMGAVAITTLAGSMLILNAHQWEFLTSLLPFLKGFTLLFWATGTWWIPIIIVLMIWRHFFKFIPITYHPQYWGMVFPLGMYTVCTYRMAHAIELPFLYPVAHVFIFLALTAWLITFVGLSRNLVSKFFNTKNKSVMIDYSKPV